MHVMPFDSPMKGLSAVCCVLGFQEVDIDSVFVGICTGYHSVEEGAGSAGGR